MLLSTSRIRLEMGRQGLTYSDLAERGGLSRQGLYEVLRRGSCTPAMAGKLANGLGVPLEDIVLQEVRTWV